MGGNEASKAGSGITDDNNPGSVPKFLLYVSHAELALAAYAEGGDSGPDAVALQELGMSAEQTSSFLDTWQPVARFADDDVGVGATLFVHAHDGQRCLAVRGNYDGKEPDSGPVYHRLREQVTGWISNGDLPNGSTVCGHLIGGWLAMVLKREFPERFAAAYSFLGNKISIFHGSPTNGGLTTMTNSCALDLALLAHHKETGRFPDLSHELKESDMRRLAALLILLELLTGCKTLTQMEMDAEVDRLCAIDGGLKIYETVTLPPEKFTVGGDINFYVRSSLGGENLLGPEYIWKWDVKYLQPGADPRANPRIWRDHTQIYRRSDGKLLGESISYTRFGGDPDFVKKRLDFPGTHYSCPEGPTSLIKHVFIKNESGRGK